MSETDIYLNRMREAETLANQSRLLASPFAEGVYGRRRDEAANAFVREWQSLVRKYIPSWQMIAEEKEWSDTAINSW